MISHWDHVRWKIAPSLWQSRPNKWDSIPSKNCIVGWLNCSNSIWWIYIYILCVCVCLFLIFQMAKVEIHEHYSFFFHSRLVNVSCFFPFFFSKVNLFVHLCDADENSRCGRCYRSLERWHLGSLGFAARAAQSIRDMGWMASDLTNKTCDLTTRKIGSYRWFMGCRGVMGI